jgi:hypothetical protein
MANYGSAHVDLIVLKAVATERERCAKIAEDKAETIVFHTDAATIARSIASAIRNKD